MLTGFANDPSVNDQPEGKIVGDSTQHDETKGFVPFRLFRYPSFLYWYRPYQYLFMLGFDFE